MINTGRLPHCSSIQAAHQYQHLLCSQTKTRSANTSMRLEAKAGGKKKKLTSRQIQEELRVLKQRAHVPSVIYRCLLFLFHTACVTPSQCVSHCWKKKVKIIHEKPSQQKIFTVCSRIMGGLNFTATAALRTVYRNQY